MSGAQYFVQISIYEFFICLHFIKISADGCGELRSQLSLGLLGSCVRVMCSDHSDFYMCLNMADNQQYSTSFPDLIQIPYKHHFLLKYSQAWVVQDNYLPACVKGHWKKDSKWLPLSGFQIIVTLLKKMLLKIEFWIELFHRSTNIMKPTEVFLSHTVILKKAQILMIKIWSLIS